MHIVNILAGLDCEHYHHLRQRAIDELHDGNEVAFDSFVAKNFVGDTPILVQASVFQWLTSQFPAQPEPVGPFEEWEQLG